MGGSKAAGVVKKRTREAGGVGGRRFHVVRCGLSLWWAEEACRTLKDPQSYAAKALQAHGNWKIQCARRAFHGSTWLDHQEPETTKRLSRSDGLSSTERDWWDKTGGACSLRQLIDHPIHSRNCIHGIASRGATLPASATLQGFKDWPAAFRAAAAVVPYRQPAGDEGLCNAYRIAAAASV